MGLFTTVSNWLLGEYKVRADDTTASGCIQHVRLDVGTGTTESQVTTLNPLPVTAVSAALPPDASTATLQSSVQETDFDFSQGAVLKNGYFDTVNGWWSSLAGDDTGAIYASVSGSVFATLSTGRTVLANVTGAGTTSFVSINNPGAVYIAIRGTYAGVSFTVEGEADSATGVVTTLPLTRIENPLVGESSIGPLTNTTRLWLVGGGAALSRIRLNVSAYTSGTANVILVQAANSSNVQAIAYQGGSWTADTELPAAVALADGAANPTAPAVGAFGMGYNGATWDRCRVSASAPALKTIAQVVTVSPGYDVITDNLTFLNDAVDLDGYEQVEFVFSGTFNLTTIFEIGTSGSSYTSFPCRYAYTDTEATGIGGASFTYRLRASNLQKSNFRVRCSSYTSGTCTVTAHCFRSPVTTDNQQVWGTLTVNAGSSFPTYPVPGQKVFSEYGASDYLSITGPGTGAASVFYTTGETTYAVNLTNTTDVGILVSFDGTSTFIAVPAGDSIFINFVDVGGYIEPGDIYAAYEATAPTKGGIWLYTLYY